MGMICRDLMNAPERPFAGHPPTPSPTFQCLGNGDQMSRSISRFSREHPSSGLFPVYPVLIQISRHPSLPNSFIPSSGGIERGGCRLGVKGVGLAVEPSTTVN
ncbi:hypothetical protein TNIN_24721 [Trichonephila inaurata madagascariensis]|uniref:Uncharacterized protein n=1 Tax=Trichonephila inaurata madagascariensis TaxID=2747483 RepID=A0A8X6IMM6_9ARAC|nr:hypothetical protein TNIN_24721 [Trichonephila inaurata madagascariensis]